MSNYVFGKTKNDILGDSPRFFYGLSRNDDGELFLSKIDQLSKDASVEINSPGDPAENYNDFVIGVDFVEGRDEFHELVFENLNHEQYRWDDKNLFYYIDEQGSLVVSINKIHIYQTGISS